MPIELLIFLTVFIYLFSSLALFLLLSYSMSFFDAMDYLSSKYMLPIGGMLTAIFSIAFTDTGTLGKLMSEAIENSDDKQKEGVASTGGSRSASLRFGIIPQILPVFVSQSLYYLESNTRAAVIIGAMGAGGIGQQFISALRTGRDFEDVAYIALWVLFIVISMDILSGMLRKRLIQSQ